MFSDESRYFSNILDGILILFECFEEKWNICQIFWVEIWYFPIVLGANRKPFKYFVWYFCVSRMFRVRTRYFFECFLYKIRYFRMFFGNQYFFKVWDKITYFLNVFRPNPDYFRIFFAQIWYFSNVLDTNTVFQKYLNSMSLKWFQRRSHIFWIFWGTDPKHSKSIVSVPQIFEDFFPAENHKKVLNIYANIRNISCW